MITIKVNDFEMDLKEINISWLSQHFHERKESDAYLCVVVRIDEQDVLMTLTSEGCRKGRVGSRPPNPKEKEILDIWNECKLNDVKISFGNIVCFIQKLKNIF